VWASVERACTGHMSITGRSLPPASRNIEAAKAGCDIVI
jgi:hypothetical protein